MFKLFRQKEKKGEEALASADLEERKKAWDLLVALEHDKWRAYTIGYLLKKGASEADAEDVFYEGLVSLGENIAQGKFRGESAPLTYLTSICWNFYCKKQRRRKIWEDIEKMELEAEDDSWQGFEEDDYQKWVEHALNLLKDKLTERCKKVMELRYTLDFSLDELAAAMDYKNMNTAKSVSEDCRKMARHILAQNPTLMEKLRCRK